MTRDWNELGCQKGLLCGRYLGSVIHAAAAPALLPVQLRPNPGTDPLPPLLPLSPRIPRAAPAVAQQRQAQQQAQAQQAAVFAAAAAAAAAPPSSLQMVPFDETRIVNGEVLDFANRRKPGRPKKPPTPATKAAEAKASVKRKLAAAGLGLIVSAVAVRLQLRNA